MYVCVYIDGLLSKVRLDLQAAVHDMNTVYLESIPADMTLEEVPPVVMVRFPLKHTHIYTYMHTFLITV